MQTVQSVKLGDLIKLPNSNVVYERGAYDRATKKFELVRWDDINRFRYVKGSQPCTTDFIF